MRRELILRPNAVNLIVSDNTISDEEKIIRLWAIQHINPRSRTGAEAWAALRNIMGVDASQALAFIDGFMRAGEKRNPLEMLLEKDILQIAS